MIDIINKMKILGFTEIEAKIYIHLLSNSGANGTQIYKLLDVSRSAIYNSLENLEKNDIIQLIETKDDRKNYIPKNPDYILNLRKKQIYEAIYDLSIKLNDIYKKNSMSTIHEIANSYDLEKIILNMIDSAKKNIIIVGTFESDTINNNLKMNNKNISILKFNSNSKDKIIMVDYEELVIIDNYSNIYTKNRTIIEQIKQRIKLEMEKK